MLQSISHLVFGYLQAPNSKWAQLEKHESLG